MDPVHDNTAMQVNSYWLEGTQAKTPNICFLMKIHILLPWI